MSSDEWTTWARARPEARVLHLDSAAAGRQSNAVLDATAAHARLEAELGAYLAQEQADCVLAGLRRDVGVLLGVPADAVAFVESATRGLEVLLKIWPLPDSPSVGVLAVEWGPNLEAFAAHGLEAVLLPADACGRLDLTVLERLLIGAPPSVVHLTQVTSHRGLVQPVAEAAQLCRAAGVPLWVDAAQAIGHVDAAGGADAVYATSRKWLTGPRGVGMLAVGERYLDALRVQRSAMTPAGTPTLAHVESHEAHVAGRIGLAVAVRALLDHGPESVHARLDDIGAMTRAALAGVPGWELSRDDAPRGAITAVRATAGQDVTQVRDRLLAEHQILVTAGAPARAPLDMREPLLRISPHVDCTADDLDQVCRALTHR